MRHDPHTVVVVKDLLSDLGLTPDNTCTVLAALTEAGSTDQQAELLVAQNLRALGQHLEPPEVRCVVPPNF